MITDVTNTTIVELKQRDEVKSKHRKERLDLSSSQRKKLKAANKIFKKIIKIVSRIGLPNDLCRAEFTKKIIYKFERSCFS